jgi:hypothetical protein
MKQAPIADLGHTQTNSSGKGENSRANAKVTSKLLRTVAHLVSLHSRHYSFQAYCLTQASSGIRAL